MKKTLAHGFAIAALASAFCAQPAQSQGISFQVKKPAQPITLAAPFTLEMDLFYPPGYSVNMDSSSLSLENFEIIKVKRRVSDQTPEKVRETVSFTAVPFDLGVSTFPALLWTLSAPDSPSTATAKSPELPLEILPFAKSDEKNPGIIDIRPPYSPVNYPLIIILLLLAAILAAAAYYLKKKKYRAGAGLITTDTRPPEVIALSELDAALKLWEGKHIKEFYNRLADIMRDYITRRFNIHAHNYTTADLCRQMRAADMNKALIAPVREFFNSCDIVKFAKHIPAGPEKDADTALFRRIIAETTPKAAPVQLNEKAALK